MDYIQDNWLVPAIDKDVNRCRKDYKKWIAVMGVTKKKTEEKEKYKPNIYFTCLATSIGVCCYIIIGSSGYFIPIAID